MPFFVSGVIDAGDDASINAVDLLIKLVSKQDDAERDFFCVCGCRTKEATPAAMGRAQELYRV